MKELNDEMRDALSKWSEEQLPEQVPVEFQVSVDTQATLHIQFNQPVQNISMNLRQAGVFFRSMKEALQIMRVQKDQGELKQ